MLTAPAEILPLDLVTPEDVARLSTMARSTFDYVVIDMPKPFMMWTETVLQAAHVYFALIELDMRSAQNVLRMTARAQGRGPAGRTAALRAEPGAGLGGRQVASRPDDREPRHRA